MADRTVTAKVALGRIPIPESEKQRRIPVPGSEKQGRIPVPEFEKQGRIPAPESEKRRRIPTLDSKGENTPNHDSAGEVHQNVLTRASSIPLVSSTYDKAAAAYASTKGSHPYLKAVLDLAEKSVKQVSDVAAGSAQPLLSKLEPQIAAANHYASKGLGKLEERLPILQQTADEVISDAHELVSSKVAEAKKAVAKTALGGAALSRAEAVLDKSEQLLDYYLPITDEELAKLAESVPDVEEFEGSESIPKDAASFIKAEPFIQTLRTEVSASKPGYFVRLGSLSTKLRHRAYQFAVTKLKMARDNIKEAFYWLQNTISLIEDMKQNDENSQKEQEEVGEVESETLVRSSRLTHRLTMAYKNLTVGIHGLPSNFLHNLKWAYLTMAELHSFFKTAQSVTDVSSGILRKAKEGAVKAQGYVDDILEYVMHNTPLSWLVGPLFSSTSEFLEEDDALEEEDPAIEVEVEPQAVPPKQ